MVSVRARVASDTKTVRKDRRPVATAAAPSFDPVADIAWSKLYWASDPAWTPPADGAVVASWRNAGSVSGDLSQTGGLRPTYAASYANLNGAPAIVHDGTDDGMTCAAFTGIPQPWTWVMVVYVPAATGTKSYGTPQFGQGGSSSFMGQVAGVWRFGVAFGSVINGGTATVGAHVLCGVADGADSRLLVDGAVVAAGTMAAASATRIITGYAGDGTTVAACAISLAGLYAGDFTAHASYDDFMAWV